MPLHRCSTAARAAREPRGADATNRRHTRAGARECNTARRWRHPFSATPRDLDARRASQHHCAIRSRDRPRRDPRLPLQPDKRLIRRCRRSRARRSGGPAGVDAEGLVDDPQRGAIVGLELRRPPTSTTCGRRWSARRRARGARIGRAARRPDEAVDAFDAVVVAGAGRSAAAREGRIYDVCSRAPAAGDPLHPGGLQAACACCARSLSQPGRPQRGSRRCALRCGLARDGAPRRRLRGHIDERHDRHRAVKPRPRARVRALAS